MPQSARVRLPAIACTVVFLVCELISRPWAEIGICDDWSYIRTTQLLAETGHIHYVGWAAAIVGWQFYLGAVMIKVFGFSFTATRVPTLLIALLTTYLMQRTLVRLGINDGNATLGTLTFVLSPLYMPLSATMMTDVPGFLSVLACFYGCIRALQALRERDAILWLCFAVAVNVICGTSRQTAWLGVLVLVPSTLWLLRCRRTVFFCGLIATALGWVFVFATLRWFARIPYGLPESFTLPAFDAPTLANMMARYDRILLTVTLLLLPVVALYLAEVRRWPRRSFALAAALASGVCVMFLFIVHYRTAAYMDLKFLLSPFAGDWVGIHGLFDGFMLNGQQPPVLIGHTLHRLLGLLTAASLLSVIVTFASRRPELSAVSSEPFRRRQLFWLFGPFLCAYMLLLLDRADAQLFDRYMFAPMFVLLFVVLRFYQRRIRPTLPAASIAMVCVLGGWGIICTHNLFALNRARVVLDKEILDAGVQPNAVDFGWEQNGWIALQQAPAVNFEKIVNPPNATLHIVDPHLSVCYGQFDFFGLYPRLAPQYGVAFDPNACAGRAAFEPVSYTSWPDLRRVTLYVVKYPPPWKAESDYAVPISTH
jgi:hypothetical protein